MEFEWSTKTLKIWSSRSMRGWLYFHFICIAVFSTSFSLQAQPFFRPLQTDFTNEAYNRLSRSGEVYHATSKGLLSTQLESAPADTAGWQRRKHKAWIMRKLRNENLIIVDTHDFYLTIDPIFNFQFGRDLEDTANTNLYTNTRGVLIQAAIGKKFAFYSSFYENQALFPSYLSEHIRETGVVPGQGRFKDFNNGGFDYAMASGALSYSPAKWVNLQFGHGKNFFGDGYRSLLLSDNTFNYPYLKATFLFGQEKWQYQVLYASLQNLNRLPATTSSEAQFIRQAGTFHNLSYSPFKMLEISLFEGVVYQNWDSTGTQPLPWNFYVPVLFLNTAVEGMSGNNAKPVIGLNLRVNPAPGFMFYGQLAFDNFSTSNTAFQAGFAAFDLFNARNLNLRLEWNSISQKMYRHQNPQNDYGHYGQWLAHPSGNDLNELVGMLRYSWHDFFVSGKWVYSDRRNLVENSLGGGIVVVTNRNENVFYQDYSLGYLLNPKTNMQIKLGYSGRNLTYVGGEENTRWFYVSFLTDLQNVYYDF